MLRHRHPLHEHGRFAADGVRAGDEVPATLTRSVVGVS